MLLIPAVLPSSCMSAEKWHLVMAEAVFIDDHTLGILVSQEDFTIYEVAFADVQHHWIAEWLRGFLVQYDLVAGKEDPVPPSIQLLYSRAPTTGDGFSEGGRGDMSGTLLEHAARKGLDTSVRGLQRSLGADGSNLERIRPRDVPEADANGMRAAGFPIEYVQFLARQGKSRAYLAMDDQFGKCMGPRIFVADTGAMYASDADVGYPMIWDHQRSRLVWFDRGDEVGPSATHVWRYVDGETDSYRLAAPTEKRLLHFHE